MVCLSRTDIEKIAEGIIATYKAAYVPKKRLCYQVNAMELAQLLGLTMDFQSLSLDCSILGLTAPEEACITIFDDDGNEMMYCLDGSTTFEFIGSVRYQKMHHGRCNNYARNKTFCVKIANKLKKN